MIPSVLLTAAPFGSNYINSEETHRKEKRAVNSGDYQCACRFCRRKAKVAGGNKNGHRRDSLPAWISSQPPNEALPSSRATAPEEVHDQRNDGDYQQKVNQPTGNVEREKSQQPQYKQHNE
jgi:hypothetical protein